MTAPIAALSQVIDDRTVASADGTRIDLPEAIERLPWKTSFCPTMPHQYVVSSWEDCDPAALDAILAMIRGSRQTVLAYWRGYQTPNRYWHGPDGFRYWASAGIFPERGDTILNRTNDADDTRPVANGGQPIPDWEGAPWAPNGSGLYEWVPGLRGWWPTAAAIASGYEPCRACQRRPPESWSARDRELLANTGQEADSGQTGVKVDAADGRS